MARFFTSDWHLGSTNINKYAHRPFASAGDAAKRLVDNCNDAAHWKSDVVFHVGDFWLRGRDSHDKVVDENTLTASCKEYLNFINAKFILLEGNHDKTNVDTDLKSMVIDLNQTWRNVSVSHYPSYADEYCGMTGTKKRPHVHLCGHVHDKWLILWDEEKNVLNVNVGTDVWHYKPVEDTKLTALLDYIWNAQLAPTSNSLSRPQFEAWKKKNDAFVIAERQRRKEAKHKAKNLTPEECQRRKAAAIAAKKLVSKA